MRETPRHEFVPDADLTVAYDPWQAVITHRFEDGRSSSCASAPWLVAAMLAQLDVQPGAPLRWRGLGHSVAFTYTDGRLVSDSMHLCGFVYLLGDDEGELSGPVTADEGVTLHWDRDQAINHSELRGVLEQPRVTAGSGTTIGRNESHDGLWLRLTGTDPRVCRLKVHADVPAEVCDPVRGWWRMALVDGRTLVYLTARRLEIGDDVRWELGAIGHGPTATELTEYLCDEIRNWTSVKGQHSPRLTVYPAGTPDSELAGPAIDKIHSRFVLTYEEIKV